MVVKVAGANQGKDSDGRALAHHTVVSEFGMESVWQRVGAAASPADYGAAAAAATTVTGRTRLTSALARHREELPL